MRLSLLGFMILIYSAGAFSQAGYRSAAGEANIPDDRDRNIVPGPQEARKNERFNRLDYKDNDFTPSSREPRQRQETWSPVNPIEEDRRDSIEDQDDFIDSDHFGIRVDEGATLDN